MKEVGLGDLRKFCERMEIREFGLTHPEYLMHLDSPKNLVIEQSGKRYLKFGKPHEWVKIVDVESLVYYLQFLYDGQTIDYGTHKHLESLVELSNQGYELPELIYESYEVYKAMEEL